MKSKLIALATLILFGYNFFVCGQTKDKARKKEDNPTVESTPDTVYTMDSIMLVRRFDGDLPGGPISPLLKSNGELYYDSVKVEGVDLHSLTAFENDLIILVMGWQVSYFKDKFSVFYEGEKITKADAPTFRYVGGSYAKDENHVYFMGKPLRNADPESFEFIVHTQYARDKNNFFDFGQKQSKETTIYWNRLLKYHGSINFHIRYTGDDEIYYKGQKLNCDPASFVSLEDGYAKDKSHAYYEGKRIKGADPETFTRTSPSEEKEIGELLGIDPYMFLHSPFAKDKNRFYYYGKPQNAK